MTWSVSFSGAKAEVKQRIVEKVTVFHCHPEVAQGLGALVESMSGPNVSISGGGSDQSVSLSISSFAPPA